MSPANFMPKLKTINGIDTYTYTREEIDNMIVRVSAHGRGLTPWEEGFIKDMNHKSFKGENFSQKQAETIERIYAEKTS